MNTTKYEAETRPNGRGGYEVGMPGTEPGTGHGNYPTEADAFFVAKYNYDEKRIKRHVPPARAMKPARPQGMAKARAAR